MRLLQAVVSFLKVWQQFPAQILDLLIDDYRQRHFYGGGRYADPLRLSRHEAQIYSQNGEDGLIAECFRRLGAHSRRFVEIGVGDGLENNTAFLLTQGWSGVWLESSPRRVRRIHTNAWKYVQEGRLKIRQALVTSENINPLLASSLVTGDIDLLSIDIDGNDYWVWQSITVVEPRVVVIEYNARYPPGLSWIMPYNPRNQFWDDGYFGASLSALEELGRQKGYVLVGCDFTGTNAFFVRQGLANGKFCAPFVAENHYEPPRYFLRRRPARRNRLA
jgi:hypothetical protein